MPVIVAAIIRSAIQMAITIGVIELANRYVLPLVNSAIAKVIELFGVSEEDATTFVGNSFINYAEQIGIGVLLLRTKLPTTVAERLGFTSKGFKVRKLSSVAESKLPKPAIQNIAIPVATVAEVETIAQTVSKSRGISFSKVNEITSFIMKIVGFPFVIIYTIAQVIDFGNWNAGAYQKSLQKVIAAVTFGMLVPDPKVASSKVLSSDVWDRLYNALKEINIVGFNDPYKLQSVMFSRQNTIDIVDKVAAQMLADGQTASLKQVIAAVLAFGVTGQTSTTSGGAVTVPPASSAPAIKVFTGTVSQSALAAAVQFTPRQDDMIENMYELQVAAKNNEAPFLASLPGRIIREIKIVSSITTKEGFVVRGTTQQIVSGYNTNGTPKYKTVTNKFAVADIYLLSEKGTRTKISRIMYGPVDSGRFKPTIEEVATMEATLRNDLKNSTLAVQNSILNPSATPDAVNSLGGNVTESSPVSAPVIKIDILPRDYFVPYDAFYDHVYYLQGDILIESPGFQSVVDRKVDTWIENQGQWVAEGIKRLKAIGYPVDSYRHKIYHNEVNGKIAAIQRTGSFEEFFGANVTISTAPAGTTLPSAALTATNLSQYYTAVGESLPSVSIRALMYEAMGLGKANLYTGTAEQNAKLLAYLQGRV